MRATEKRYSNTSTPSSKATDLDGLIYGYKLCARSEGKSPKTILITITALRSLLRFLRSNRHSINVCEINTDRLREYVLYLQQVKKFAHHPFTKPQDKGLSGQSVNCYLRAIRAFWSWLVKLIRKAKQRPTIRRSTKAPPASKERRLENKRHGGETKRLRKPIQPDNE